MLKTFSRLLRSGEKLNSQFSFSRKLKQIHIKQCKRRFGPLKLVFDFLSSMEGEAGKIVSCEFKRIITPEVNTLYSAFIDHGYELRIVGGAVRDLLRGKAPKDIDFSTNATPKEMVHVFKDKKIRYIETGLQHGTVTAHINKKDFEVTTLRVDVTTDGRHAKVQFTSDWKVDAERRDLTINAMSLALDGTLYDYFNGRQDLEQNLVRFVGDPRKRIMEDFLRILRYFRFYGRIAPSPNQHDKETLEIIKDTAKGLKMIAVERIWMELSMIFVGNHSPSLLKLMYDLDVASYIGLPEYTEEGMGEFSQAWNQSKIHSLQPVTLLCSLVNTAYKAELLARDFKLSNAERILGKFLTEHRQPKHHEDPIKPYLDMLVCSPSAQSKETLRSHIKELLHYQGRHDLANKIATWPIPLFPLTGEHLKKFGMKPGPEFGRVLSQLKRIWKDSYYVATEQDLIDKIQTISKK